MKSKLFVSCFALNFAIFIEAFIIRRHYKDQSTGSELLRPHQKSQKSHHRPKKHLTALNKSSNKHSEHANQKLFDKGGKPRKAFSYVPLIPVLTIPPPGVDPIFMVHNFANTLLPFKWMTPLIGVNVQPMPIKNGDLTIKLPKIKNPVVIDEFPTYQSIGNTPSNYLDASGELIRESLVKQRSKSGRSITFSQK